MIIGISGKIGSGKDTVGKLVQYLTNPFDRDMNTQFDIFEDYNSGSEFQNKKFADKLKDIVCILIGCTREQLEDREFKETELGEEWWYYNYGEKNVIIPYLGRKNEKDEDIKFEKYLVKPTIRQLLQEIGTEAMRDTIHPNIWINALFVDYDYKIRGSKAERNNKIPNWVITDLRFPNELKAIKDKKGITIRVNRDWRLSALSAMKHEKNDGSEFLGNDLQRIEEHPSETALDNAEFDYVIDNNGTIEELIEKVKEILIKENII